MDEGVSGCAPNSYIYHRVDTASQGEAMAVRDLKATDPAAHQPTKADLEEDVSINATPEALAWAVTCGGAERNEPKGPQNNNP